MDSKLTLVHCLMLIYWESLMDVKSENSASMVKATLETIKLPEAVLETDQNRDIIVGLRSTIYALCQQPIDQPIDKIALLQRIRINCKDDVSLYDSIAQAMIDTTDQGLIRQKCNEYSRHIIQGQKERQFKDLIRGWMSDVLYSDQGQALDIKNITLKMQNELEPFSMENKANGVRGIEGVVDYVDFDQLSDLTGIFKRAKEEVTLEGILRTGYQGINRMMGDYGGFRRGDMIVVGAFQHNYKTGFTLNLTKQIALYNKPYMINPEKKPLILHISSENHATDNIMLLYKSLMENMTGEVCDTSNLDETTAALWIKEQMESTGYHFKMMRVNPSTYTYSSLFATINQLESEGFEIHFLCIDYLNMFNKAGCINTFTGSDTRDLFRRVRNFCSERKITCLTPHQISTEAKQLLRQGVDNIVKELANKSYWDSCKTLDQEVDIELLIHIEKVNGKSFLSVQRGKHRKSGAITPDKDLYCVLPFFDIGAIRDDVNGKDLSSRKLEEAGGLEGEGAWF